MIVVTMTSWIKRIHFVRRVLESVLSQTVLPDRIYLNLSEEEFKGISLPEDLVRYINSQPRIILNWVKGPNTKPFKKIFPILKFISDDDIIINIDDDDILDKNLIASRLIDFNKYRTCVTGGQNTIKWYAYGMLPEVKHYMIACSLYQKKMLKHWEEILTPEIIATKHDDAFYCFMCYLNGYLPARSTQSHFSAIEDTVTALHGDVGCADAIEATLLNIKTFKQKFNTNPVLNYFKTNTDKMNLEGSSHRLKFIMLDRVRKAGDNGEYFYRFLKEQSAFDIKYILRSDSCDWDRLKKDGFNLIDATDKELVDKELKTADYLCFAYFPRDVEVDDSKCSAKKIFLNHGCFYRVLPYLKKRADKFDLMVAGNKIEYNTLLYDYGFNSSKIALTGLPRQDHLIKLNKAYSGDTNNILIQFWWRPWLRCAFLEDFVKSEFYKNISRLFTDDRLAQISKKYNIKFLFKLHCEMEPYAKLFSKFKNITLIPNDEPFEPLFLKSKAIITDYSSNAYEMGTINKPCVYFRPDWLDLKQKLLDRDNTILDLEKVGIGPYADTLDEFFSELEKLIKNNYRLDQKYIDRRKEQIVFLNDAGSCERLLHRILMYFPIREKPVTNKPKVKVEDTLWW